MNQVLSFLLLLLSFSLNSQVFKVDTLLLQGKYHSGGVVGFCDVDGDFLDDIIIIHESKFLHVAYQNQDGSFSEYFLDTVSYAPQWGMSIGDIDANGFKDVMIGGEYDRVKRLNIYARDSVEWTHLERDSIFMQACNIADFNQDGRADFFACHDEGVNRIWLSDSSNVLRFDESEFIDLKLYDGEISGSDLNSGSYGSVWSDVDNDGDLDLYIARCKQGVSDPEDPRRINQFWENKGDSGFVENALERGLVVYKQSWTSDFADIDNDGDFDCLITNHSGPLSMLENDGNGYFTDITESSGLEVLGFFLQGIFKDFDNDGYVDLILAGSQRYFRNNGDKTFSEIKDILPNGREMNSFAIGDANQDGFLDIYASYGRSYVSPHPNYPDKLWLNEGNENNWIAFDLQANNSNKDAIGAKVKVHGDFGVQVKEIRAGESYGITNSYSLRFGVGQEEEIGLIEIQWPDGTIDRYGDLAVNMRHRFYENHCEEPIQGSIAVTGDLIRCPGGSVELRAPFSKTYMWSNGEETRSISVNEPGVYYAQYVNADSCNILSDYVVVEDLDFEDPSFTWTDRYLCSGDSVFLESNSNGDVWWSNGVNENSQWVKSSGDYQLYELNDCGTTDSSLVLNIEIGDYPETAVLFAAYIDENDTTVFELEALGDWYEDSLSTLLLNRGEEYRTAWVGNEMSFWVESLNDYGAEDLTILDSLDLTEGFYSNAAHELTFSLKEDMFLRSFDLISESADSNSFRIINDKGEVLWQNQIDIVQGEQSIELNLFLNQGNNYRLISEEGGANLWVAYSTSEFDYPLVEGGVEILRNDYSWNWQWHLPYFSNLKFDAIPHQCFAPRVEVSAVFTSIEEKKTDLSIYPNPSNGEFWIEGAEIDNADWKLYDSYGRIIKEGRITAQKELVNLTSTEGGVYFLVLKYGEELYTSPIIIE